MRKITNYHIACGVAIGVPIVIALLAVAGDPMDWSGPVLHAGNGALIMWLLLSFSGRLKDPDAATQKQ